MKLVDTLFDQFLSDEDVDITLRALHQIDEMPGKVRMCSECGWLWPCATIKVLDRVKANKNGASE